MATPYCSYLHCFNCIVIDFSRHLLCEQGLCDMTKKKTPHLCMLIRKVFNLYSVTFSSRCATLRILNLSLLFHTIRLVPLKVQRSVPSHTWEMTNMYWIRFFYSTKCVHRVPPWWTITLKGVFSGRICRADSEVWAMRARDPYLAETETPLNAAWTDVMQTPRPLLRHPLPPVLVLDSLHVHH